ncbi:hypothetical protein SUGI_0449400 [Cryptomeria japonica]|nr:hypothetical protein SUGI_0449400 [Cryptomeria japonica]
MHAHGPRKSNRISKYKPPTSFVLSESFLSEGGSSMVGVMCLPEPKPGNVLAALSPSLASFIQQLPPSNGSAPDMDMLIETFNNDVPCFKLESLSEGNADEARGGYLMKSSHSQSNIEDPTLKLYEGNEAHMINLASSLASFIHKLPIVNGPSPNVDKVIFALLHGDISFRKSGFASTSRRANSLTMNSFQTSHPLKRKQDDDDKEEVVHKKPSMDIFKLRQIRKLKLQAKVANQNQSGTNTSRTTSGTTSHTTSGTTSRTSSTHS